MTDRYTEAIEQLGSDNLDVRIVGICALERIAPDVAEYHPTVMEVLTEFIREHSREPWVPAGRGAEAPERTTRRSSGIYCGRPPSCRARHPRPAY